MDVPLLRLFVVRYLFCYAVLALHVDFQSGPPAKTLPHSSPALPVDLTLNAESQRVVEALAHALGVARLFKKIDAKE